LDWKHWKKNVSMMSERTQIDLQRKAEQAYARLNQAYGEPLWRPHRSPMEQLIVTILSANTNDVNSGRAFHQLMERFDDDWDAIRTAPLEEIKTAIRPAGMYNQKAPHIVRTLEMIYDEQGGYSLDHVAQMPVDEALVYLTRFPGVGHKTASIVLLFCFNAGSFPVDTHVQRISQRLGVAPRKSSPEQVKRIWESLLPPETYYALHINLIRHGREICRARTPRCEVCPVNGLCDYYGRSGAWEGKG
jgi:endonuclease-3